MSSGPSFGFTPRIGLSGDLAARVSAYFRRATVAQRRWAAEGTTVPDGLPFNHA
jgi:hypothetical protein